MKPKRERRGNRAARLLWHVGLMFQAVRVVRAQDLDWRGDEALIAHWAGKKKPRR